MKRLVPLLAVLLLATAAPTTAQNHPHADSAHAPSMGRMQMMMQMHERMMADPGLHQRVMDDPEMHALMAEMMGGEHDMAAMHERMTAMPPDERRQMMQQMHARMKERVEAMPPEQREALMKKMVERMHEDGMRHEGTDHDNMDHDRMDHNEHEKMDRGVMDAMRMDPMSAGDALAAAAAGRTADRFHTALAAGDRAAVEAFLLPNAVVLEAGKTEDRAEYLGHHFRSDTAFLAAVERERLTRTTDVAGDAAWVATTSRLAGTVEGRALDLDSAELLVLRRDASAPDGWRVAAVHWSSASRK